MSKEILDELKSILREGTLKPFIINNPIDRNKLYQESKYLSLAERAQLFQIFWTFPGTVLHDPGDLFGAVIRIADKHSEASEARPLAYIEFVNREGGYSLVEVIDILESVRNDATLIGHPVIIYAIQHWQQLLIWEKKNVDKSIHSQKDFVAWFGYEVSGKYIESARKNLEEIGKALFESVRRQSIPKEYALHLKIQNLKIENENTYLHIAWERLSAKHINQTHDLNERIKNIEEFLFSLHTSGNSQKYLADYPKELQKYGYIDTAVSIATVIEFLKSDGSKYVYSDDGNQTRSLKPNRKVFKRAFLSWYFQKEGDTLDKYQKTAQSQKVEAEPYTAGWFSNSSNPKDLYDILSQTLCKPLVKFCEPIKCTTSELTSQKFSELINQHRTK